MNKIHKLLLLFVIVGIFLRFYRFDSAIGWWGDSARDYLVAYHLASFNEALMVGHFATGLSSGFYHPPYYYYTLSLLVRIFESPFFVSGFFVLLHALSVISMYEIGKELYGAHTGLLSALLFAVSAKMVNTSRGLISANATLPLILISLVFFIKGIKNAHKGYVYVGLTILLLAGSFWYGIFTLLPYLLVFTFWRFRNQHQFLITFGIFIFVGLLIVELPLILSFGADRVVQVFLPQNNIGIDPSFFTSFIDVVRIYFLSVFNQNLHFSLYGAVFLVLLILFLLWKSPGSLRALILPISAVIYIALLSSFRKGEFLVHYITPYEPIMVLIAGYLLTKAFLYVRTSHLLQISIVVCGGALTLLFSDNFSYVKYFPSDYQESSEIAHLVVQEMGSSSFHAAVSTSDTPPGWESPTLWYFLERDFHTKLVHTANYGENFEEINQEYAYRIFVCKNFETAHENDVCYEKLRQQYARYVLLRTIKYYRKNKYVVYITKAS